MAYYAATARNTGVPEMWVEDAAQEIAIAVWKAGLFDAPVKEQAFVIRRRAVDAARRYGQRSRTVEHKDRVYYDYFSQWVEPPVSAPDWERGVIAWIDTWRAWAQLTPQQRRSLSTVYGTKDGQYVRRYRARRRLKELVA